ncbi:MAG: Hsp20/alpha crystallin family protein [Cyclobacteriaceae bacterium]|nr:Hsp20/alpha crystallin family protein [Cyclobacteriaceae bacterium]
MNDFFESDWPMTDWNGGMLSEWVPAANVKEDEKRFMIELSVPGYAKKDIHVELEENNMLRINGERKDESEEERANFTRKEFSYGSFSRLFKLPEEVNEGKIEAKCHDGILFVELPKKESAIAHKKAKEIQIA